MRDDKGHPIKEYYKTKKRGNSDKKKVNLPLLMCYHKLVTETDSSV
jgi:hypothetical protein